MHRVRNYGGTFLREGKVPSGAWESRGAPLGVTPEREPLSEGRQTHVSQPTPCRSLLSRGIQPCQRLPGRSHSSRGGFSFPPALLVLRVQLLPKPEL